MTLFNWLDKKNKYLLTCGKLLFFITFNIYGAYFRARIPGQISIKILLKASFLASASIGRLSLRLVDDANKNYCSRNGWILHEFCFLRCYGPSRSRRSLQRKKGTRLISIHQKRFYYTAQIFWRVYFESQKRKPTVFGVQYSRERYLCFLYLDYQLSPFTSPIFNLKKFLIHGKRNFVWLT